MNRGLKRVKPRELRELYEQAQEQGCTLTLSRSNHWRITRPGYEGCVTGPNSASDTRSVNNTRALLRRVLEVEL